jgi:hypothetical protein
MTEREDFLARWSRLKKTNRTAGGEPEGSPVGQSTADSTPHAAAVPSADSMPHAAAISPADAAAPPQFDATSLPPIESLTAESDIRPFMQLGVPPELKLAALRAAWIADPTIRDFVGVADSQWDFNDPNAMPGFGPLEGTDSASKLFAQRASQLRTGPALLPALTEVPAPSTGSRRDGQLDRVWLSSVPAQTTPARVTTNVPVAPKAAIGPDAEPTSQPDPQQPAGPRRHGSALPRST